MRTPAPTARPVPSAVTADVVFGAKPSVASRGIPCDRCPAAPAKARAVLATGELYLCGHHLREGWDALTAAALSLDVDVPRGSFHLPLGASGPGEM